MSTEVRIFPRDFDAVVLPARRSFLDQAAQAPLTSASVDLYHRGIENATYLAPVKFILDATLGVLALPQVEARLPWEVTHRDSIARQVGQYITEKEIKQGTFANFILRHPGFIAILDPEEDAVTLTDPNDDKLYRLGASPFSDASMSGGGAFRVLREAGVEEPTEVITRSSGLLRVAGIDIVWAKEAENFLGYPYARAEHFVINEGPKGITVDFTEKAQEHLQRFMADKDGGCPAKRVPATDDSRQSLLREYWIKVVKYLMPPDATVDYDR